MASFKVWLEQKDQNIYARQKGYFDQVMRILQATKDDLNRSLDELPAVKTPQPANGESQPPAKGRGALSKVQNLLSKTLAQMSGDRTDADTSVRARRTMEMLNSRSNNTRVEPNLFLQDLLRELFGNDFHEEFIDTKSDQSAPPMPPDQNAAIQSNPQSQPDLNDPTTMQSGPPEMQVPRKKPFGGQQFV